MAASITRRRLLAAMRRRSSIISSVSPCARAYCLDSARDVAVVLAKSKVGISKTLLLAIRFLHFSGVLAFELLTEFVFRVRIHVRVALRRPMILVAQGIRH